MSQLGKESSRQGYVPSPKDGRVRFIFRFQAKPGKMEQARDVVERKWRLTRQEPGNSLYELWQSADNPDEFVALAEFASTGAVDQHEAQDYARAFYALMEDLLVAPPTREAWLGF